MAQQEELSDGTLVEVSVRRQSSHTAGFDFIAQNAPTKTVSGRSLQREKGSGPTREAALTSWRLVAEKR